MLILSVFTLAPSFVHAQVPGTLTLEQAIDIALEHSPTLRTARAQVASKQASVEGARGSYLPEVSASASASYQYSNGSGVATELAAASGTGDNGRSILAANISASWNLFNGFADQASVSQASLNLEAQTALEVRSREQVAFETISRFIKAASDAALIEVEKENVEGNHQLLEQVQAFWEAGTRPVSDYYQQQAVSHRAERTLMTAKRNLQVDKLELLQTMGLSPDQTFELVPPELDALGQVVKEPELSATLQAALKSRADIAAQQKSIDAAAEQVTVARAGMLPSLNMVASLGTDHSSASTTPFAQQFFDENIGASLGLQLSVPIFDRKRTRTNVQLALIQQQVAELSLESKSYQVGVELGQALADYTTLQKQIEVTRSQEAYARKALEAIDERYQVGAATLVEVTQARAAQLDAAYEQIKAAHDLALQAVTVRYYQGTFDGVFSLNSAEK